jgi:voltage-gated potassium channel Kch
MKSDRKRERDIRWPTSAFLKKKAWRLVSHPIFLVLSLFGNLLIAAGAIGLYWAEIGVNPHIHNLLDTIWWAVATVTTVGYGDISPMTAKGKVIGIILMIIGTALFWSYTALFADALISEELDDFQSELKNIESKLRRLRSVGKTKEANSDELIARIEKMLSEINKSDPQGEIYEIKPR